VLSRRDFLASCSAFGLLQATNAAAIIPAVAGALAALTALAVATGKAAQALEGAVDKGQRLWSRIKSIPGKEKAARLIAEQQDDLVEKIKLRREVVRIGAESQLANAAFLSKLYEYTFDPVPAKWLEVKTLIQSAAAALRNASAMFRSRAAWFPTEAQEALSELPSLYREREKLMSNLYRLPSESPPPDDIEILAKGYETLRSVSLRLLTALDKYLQ
jgi:hypothetical protein